MNFITWHFSPSLVEAALERVLPCPDKGVEPERARLQRAMRSAVFGGGKRLRSQLLLEAAHVASTHTTSIRNGGPRAAAEANLSLMLSAACALELIHAYSLAHDDLPAMDDADTRRGRPSCHKEYGEATAILVGDALLTLAFETLASASQSRSTHVTSPQDANTLDSSARHEVQSPCNIDSVLLLRATALIARAAGEAGMVGGQMVDIAWSNPSERDEENIALLSGERVLAMYALKTGALIRAACEAGAVLGEGDEKTVDCLARYGTHLGRAFQLRDDLLDVEGDPQKTGKGATDAANDKMTAPALLGIEATRTLARRAHDEAIAALSAFGSEADALRELARFVVERET